ncbi:MAG TPA: hypothetical protein VNX65_05000 [Patescibacteria group bacterium]|jgi:hypothetical protein|nr:hypothetical protein [Patescibacteria group bacterium]
MSKDLTNSPTPTSRKPQPIRDKLFVIVAVFFLVMTALNLIIPRETMYGLLIGGLSSLKHNDAKDAAAPLERDLVSNGAIKNCKSNYEVGIDNHLGYTADYELPIGRTEAIALINDIASKHGFTLHHAIKADQTGLNGTADIYLDDIYLDHTSNPTHVSPGPLKLTFTVSKKDLTCAANYKVSHSDTNHTALYVDVKN